MQGLLSEGTLYSPAFEFLYPPFFAFLVVPLLRFPVSVAENIWFLILLAALFSSFFLLVTSFSKRSSLLWALSLFVFSQFEPLYVELSYSNVDLLILFTLVVAYRLEQKGLFFWSGVCLALGALIKITPASFLFYFLITKKWKSILGFLGGLLFFSALTFLLVGVKGWSDFFLVGVPQLLVGNTGNRLNQSFANSLLRIYQILGRGEGLGKSSPWVWAGSFAFTVVIIFSLWHFIKKGKHRPLGLEYAAVICAMLLSSPTMNETHLVILLFPFSILIGFFFQNPPKETRWVFWTGVAFTIVALRYGYTAPFLGGKLWGLPLAKARFFGTCLTYLCCLFSLREENKKACTFT